MSRDPNPDSGVMSHDLSHFETHPYPRPSMLLPRSLLANAPELDIRHGSDALSPEDGRRDRTAMRRLMSSCLQSIKKPNNVESTRACCKKTDRDGVGGASDLMASFRFSNTTCPPFLAGHVANSSGVADLLRSSSQIHGPSLNPRPKTLGPKS